MKKIIFILISTFSICFGDNLQDVKIVTISIPKCGTFLLGKYMKLVTGRKLVIPKDVENYDVTPWFTNYTKNYIRNLVELNYFDNLEPDEFSISHLFHMPFYLKFFKEKNIKTIFIYRDPRDQIVSMAFYILPGKWWPKASQMPFDELIMNLITNGSILNNLPPMTTGIQNLYEKYLPWLNETDVLSVRFEDLIGINGGGSVQSQLLTLRKIAHHVGIHISEEKLHEIMNEPFGNGMTFRDGQIGAWKKYFNKEHIKAFKDSAGDLLIKLGYEKDMNW